MGQTNPLQSQDTSKTGARLDALGHPSSRRMFLIVGLIVPLIAFLPMLFTVARELWLQPPFRFFPVAIVAGIAFLVRTCKAGFVDQTRGWISFAIVLVGILVGVWGMFLLSPTRVQLATVVVVLGWALGWYGETRWTRIVAIWTIFLVTVPLPFSLSERISQLLLTFAGSACNGFLEAIYIPSVFEGLILRAEGVELSVYEIGRDAGGLLALMSFALIWLVYWRRSFVVAKSVVISVVVCVLMANVLRLLTILFVAQWWGWDLAHGWSGILMGIATFLMSILFVICSDYAATAWFAPLDMGETPNQTMRMYQRWVAWPAPETKHATPYPDAERAWIYLGLPSALCLIFGLMTFFVLYIKGQPVSPLDSILPQIVDRMPGETVFPDQFANLKRAKFESENRETPTFAGKYSRSWQLDGGDALVHISLDFPFASVSSPEVFYKSAGWEIEKNVRTEIPGEVPLLIQQVTISNRFGVSATAWHSHFDETGRPATENAINSNARSHLFSLLQQTNADEHRYFQVRMFVETGRELTNEQLEPYQQLFLQVFERLRQSSTETLNASL